jgi:hypothetical protein
LEPNSRSHINTKENAGGMKMQQTIIHSLN